MGFLKFLKRERKEDALEELDMPPAPPPLEGFEEGSLPELPGFPEEDISAKDIEMPEPKFDFPEKGEEMPDFPGFQEFEESTAIPPVSAPATIPEPMPAALPVEEPVPAMDEELPKFTPKDAYPKIEGRLFHHERRAPRATLESKEFEQVIKSGKIVYLRVDEFKLMLGNINMARSDLKKSDEALMRLENIKLSKDKSFDRFKASLEDLQKKLIFIDKTLFKGG